MRGDYIYLTTIAKKDFYLALSYLTTTNDNYFFISGETGYKMQDAGYSLLVARYSLLVTRYWLLGTRFSLLVRPETRTQQPATSNEV